ncbi:MAG: TraB/GumN family protein [Candidatus Sulfobium sp.]
MRVKTAVALTVLFIFALVGSHRGPSADEKKHFMWQVRSESGTAYLLGSVHLMKKYIYPLETSIEEAFGESDVLAVEANINSLNPEEAGEIAEKSLYPPGDSLKKHISGRTYDMVKDEANKTGLPAAIADRQRPWALALTFTSLELMKAGFDPRYGIDRHFLSEAEGRKKIVELESLGYQLDLLAGLSDAEQEMFLIYTLKDVRRLGAATDKMLDAWKSGNGREMASLLSGEGTEDKGLSLFYGRLLYERNRNMAVKIEELLRNGGTCFVVVGAGHLVGKKGIIEILKDRGYRVKQL